MPESLKDNEDLAALEQQMYNERLVTSADDLHIGDIIYVEMDRSDGLVLNSGYDTRLKYVVVAGSKSNQKDFGVVLINSDADYSDAPDWIAEQYPLLQKNYVGILDKDSWADCTDPKELPLRKMKAKKAERMGRLTDEDLQHVMQLLKDSSFVEPHFKKVYHINNFKETK